MKWQCNEVLKRRRPPNQLLGWSYQRHLQPKGTPPLWGAASYCSSVTWNTFGLRTPENYIDAKFIDAQLLLTIAFRPTWYGVECKSCRALWMKSSHSDLLKMSRKMATWGSLLRSSYLKGPIFRYGSPWCRRVEVWNDELLVSDISLHNSIVLFCP